MKRAHKATEQIGLSGQQFVEDRWQWPFDAGPTDHKQKLIRFMRSYSSILSTYICVPIFLCVIRDFAVAEIDGKAEERMAHFPKTGKKKYFF